MADFFVPSLKKYVEEKITGPIRTDERITFSLNDIRRKDRELSAKIVEDPISFIPFVEHEMRVKFAFTGSFGEYQHTPSSITSDFLGKMVKVEGIITSLSNIKPKLRKSVHEQHNTFYSKEYRDATTLSALPLTNTVIPQTLKNEPLNFEYGLSTYIDTQTATIQEMPENTKPGAMPRSMNVILYDDLTDSLKPGDRVVLTGVYKTYCYNNTSFPNYLPTALIVNHVENKNIKRIFEERLKKATHEYTAQISEEDGISNQEIGGIGGDQTSNVDFIAVRNTITSENALEYVAPFIFISPLIKKAILLQMIGSENEVCRKSINLLLLGDPSTAKSQILRFVINTMNAISTSGKGSTGVGLTASIVSDKNERRLEAGAMVLADNSIICIDEFDKINYNDSVVLHEVMEQQSISINKAGIHVTLNARTAVLAAANPVYGNFVDDSLEKQVKIPESLLSRFDLIFLIVDDGSFDSQIADQVLCNHSSSSDLQDDRVFELRRFIFECKKYKPRMRKECAHLIIDYYVELRRSKTRFPVTPRLLDSLIRLSNANARFRQSDTIDEIDVKEAITMVEHCYTIPKGSQFKRMKVDKYDTEMSIDIENTRNAVTSEVSDATALIKEVISKYREENPDSSFLSLNDVAARCELPLEEITRILTELDAEDIIMFKGETIIFLN
ncbi:DNA replication licensing factor, MCM3 component [Trachipleistophora hominis]|uniref:DNA replication licensing factor, MCM3 component n=1 Tax=Trachipleistophora hominis TaxID=72359 RepID=L7JXV0_TRAHO|nr:DNA replication licensing factor, MCM3 component [Trachipleistophora hominis]